MRHLSGALSVLLLALQVTCSPAFADDADTCARAAGDERIAACTRVIAAGRGNLAWAFNNRGNAYQRKGDNDRAIADYDQAIRLDPKNAASYANRGGAYLGKGDNDRAMADYDQAIKLDPKEPAAWNNRCWLRTTIGQLEGALADCNESLRLKPGDSGALDSRGFTYLRLTQLEKAIEDFDVVLRIDAKNAHSLYARGIAKRLSNIAGGDMDIKMAMAIEPNIAEEFTPYGYAASSVAGLSKSSPDVARAVPADPGRRVALVIGNSAYSAFPTIPNPRNDADDVANALRALGFDVLLGQDLKRADMEDLLIRFARKTDKADTALVFYAGHGLQYNGTNYLVPVDARIDDDADQRKLINLAQVINDLQNAARVRILIVDACRDNNVVQQLALRSLATRTRGLARIEGADGTLIAFATQPNRVAADGAGRNSPFTRALLKHMPTPGLELRTLMTRVRSEVVSATNGAQRPEVWDSLVGEFTFKAGP